MSIKSINPANGRIIKSYREDSGDVIARKIRQTQVAWIKWRESDFASRSALMNNLADGLHKERENLAGLMALEMGKPLRDGVAEIEKCAAACKYYADHAAGLLTDQLIPTDASKSYVSFQPLGVVLAIMPWNFPFWQVFRFLAPL